MFHKNLIAALGRYPEDSLVGLLRRTDDRACWDALAASIRRGSWKVRLVTIEGAQSRWVTTPEQDKKTRRERLRFLVGFLNDETSRGTPIEPASYRGEWELQVRDFAALSLAWEFGLWKKVQFDPNRGPFSHLLLRATVAKLAAEELARLKK